MSISISNRSLCFSFYYRFSFFIRFCIRFDWNCILYIYIYIYIYIYTCRVFSSTQDACDFSYRRICFLIRSSIFFSI